MDLSRLDVGKISFGAPEYLWLLVVPALLLVVGVWRLAIRSVDSRRLARRRTLPVRERLAFVGDLPFWLCVVAATGLLIVALARPQGPSTALHYGGIDLVILQDASASARVKDVSGDRWQRSMRFLRALGDSLSWRTDRVAMAIFARIASPQIRLTKDPNTFFFFLDHLDKEPPFRLENISTWDTNLELGIHWGLRLVERDREVHGPSRNAQVFIVLSDGELWSGAVQNSLKDTIEQGIPVFVVGVGTLGGGQMPSFTPMRGEDPDADVPRWSRLDRKGLQQIAAEGRGQYFELDHDSDRQIANAIVDYGRRIAPSLGVTNEPEELYWQFLVFAAVCLGAGMLFVHERPELWIQLVGAGLMLVAASFVGT